MLLEQLIGLCKNTVTQRFLMAPKSWFQRIERREITEGYRGYMQFDMPLVSLENVLLDLFNLSNFLSLDPVRPKTNIICFWFQTVQNDWLWRKVFESFITILNVSADIIDLFFQLVSIFEKLSLKVTSLNNWKYLRTLYTVCASIYS